jgi:N-acyl homoserine lactone hydrolase
MESWLLEGDVEDVLPGIDVFAAVDSHTFGSRFIRIRQSTNSEKDSWILARDLGTDSLKRRN